MATVESSIHIDVPPEQVFELARQVERFPEMMPNIESVEVAERDGDKTITKWVASVPEMVKRTISAEGTRRWTHCPQRTSSSCEAP